MSMFVKGGSTLNDARHVVDETVLLQLKENEGLNFLGVPEEGPFFCKVVAVDEAGVWVENSKFVTLDITDSKGKVIPKNKRKPEKHVVNILFPWKDIRTIVRFADQDADRIVDELLDESGGEDRRIGFIK